METDEQLLTRWTRQRDPAAFAGLAERHAGLVYGTCRRITGDHHVAEDLAQDVLLELAQQARRVRRSVAGFLHAAARSRALNHLRDERIRQRHEQAAGGVAPIVTVEPTVWQDLEPHLDAALAELDEAERTVLLLHFLEGRSQVEIAELLGTTQATVSRRIKRGLETLRTRLASAGLVLTVGLFTELCAAHAIETAPPVVLAAVPKITLAAAGAMTGIAVIGGLWLWVGVGLVAISVAAVLATAPWRRDHVLPSSSSSDTDVALSHAATSVRSKDAVMSTPAALPGPIKPIDWTQVDLRGDGFVQDTFCLAIAEAARLLGRPIRYEEVLALTGNAFAPGFDTGNDCKELWVAQAWVSHRGPIEVAWRRLGLQVEPILYPDHSKNPTDLVKVIAAAMAEGKVVVTSAGGWDPRQVEPWWAGIVTEVRGDGTVWGAHPTGGGRRFQLTPHNGELHAVSLIEPTQDGVAIVTDLARLAISRIRAQGGPDRYGRQQFCAFGIDAMEDWIVQMRSVAHFCPVCLKKHGAGWSAAVKVAQAMRHRSGIAADWLRTEASLFPLPSQALQAAACYERIAALLAPAVAKDGPDRYQAFLGDLAQQQRHADEVLVPVRAALEEAAGHLEHALTTASAPAQMHREADRVVINGVPGEEYVKGIWHLDGLPASLRAVFASKGVDPVFLDDTVFAAILGQPFRFWFSEDFSSCLAYTAEAPLGVMAADTLGFSSVWHAGGFGGITGEDIERGRAALAKGPVDEAWAQVTQLLTQGHPVVVFGGRPTRNRKDAPSVLVGFTKGGSDVYVLPHATWEPAPAWDDGDPACVAGLKEQGYRARPRPDQTNWIGSGFAPGQGMGGAASCFFAVTDRLRTPTWHEVAVAVLRRALAIGRGEVFDRQRPGIKGGLVGLDLLAKSLVQVPMNRHRDPDWWYAMEGLAHPAYRRTAAAFLSRCATDFGAFTEGQKTHLRSAAEAYGESSRQFDLLWRHVATAGSLDGYEERVATVARVLASPTSSAQASAIVECIIVAEQRALDEIAAVLADLSPGPPRR